MDRNKEMAAPKDRRFHRKSNSRDKCRHRLETSKTTPTRNGSKIVWRVGLSSFGLVILSLLDNIFLSSSTGLANKANSR